MTNHFTVEYFQRIKRNSFQSSTISAHTFIHDVVLLTEYLKLHSIECYFLFPYYETEFGYK